MDPDVSPVRAVPPVRWALHALRLIAVLLLSVAALSPEAPIRPAPIPPAAIAAPGDPHASAPAVLEIGLTVDDLDRSIDFFTRVLDFEVVASGEQAGEAHERLEGVFGLRTRTARLRLGDEFIELTDYLAPEGRPHPADSASNDRWFQHVAIVVSDMSRAYAHLRRHGVRHASSGPQRLPDSNPAAGGIEAFYFKDPDGHVLEVIAFPPGKGDARWPALAARGDALFLGIDHTAIVVDDTATSLAFWRDALGLAVAGTSENSGPEQERLNNVFGARLHITGLRGASGPGVEFLEYLSPDGGRPYPADARANDLLHWETRLVVPDLDEVGRRLLGNGARPVSHGVVSLPDGRRALLLRDPDGHAVELHAADRPASTR